MTIDAGEFVTVARPDIVVDCQRGRWLDKRTLALEGEIEALTAPTAELEAE
jgi:hypothetical protein